MTCLCEKSSNSCVCLNARAPCPCFCAWIRWSCSCDDRFGVGPYLSHDLCLCLCFCALNHYYWNAYLLMSYWNFCVYLISPDPCYRDSSYLFCAPSCWTTFPFPSPCPSRDPCLYHGPCFCEMTCGLTTKCVCSFHCCSNVSHYHAPCHCKAKTTKIRLAYKVCSDYTIITLTGGCFSNFCDPLISLYHDAYPCWTTYDYCFCVYHYDHCSCRSHAGRRSPSFARAAWEKNAFSARIR
jgi:hypothetical protein